MEMASATTLSLTLTPSYSSTHTLSVVHLSLTHTLEPIQEHQDEEERDWRFSIARRPCGSTQRRPQVVGDRRGRSPVSLAKRS
jgi:hypothetical protein